MDAPRLPPTSETLTRDGEKPYFLWWSELTVGELRTKLRDPDPEVRCYWLGALLREANSRDVWLFTTPDEIRGLWPRLLRYLGRAGPMWAWLLGMPPQGGSAWTPSTGA